MSPEEEEAYADRYYSSQAWVERQAELVSSLLQAGHPVLAHSAIQGVRLHISMWPDIIQMNLMEAYNWVRSETSERLRSG